MSRFAGKITMVSESRDVALYSRYVITVISLVPLSFSFYAVNYNYLPDIERSRYSGKMGKIAYSQDFF